MEEPAFLPVGTEVSAKYRGAFCEAKVKKIVKAIKIKVTLKQSGLPLVVTACSDEDVKGQLKIGSNVEVKHPESGQYVEATICKITDQSSYTVVFDDADENTLRRTQLCLKGEKHFVKTETLDELPLTNPEHFGTPVLKGSKKKRRSATANVSSDSDSGEESDEPEPRHYWGRLRDMVGKVVCFQQDDRKKTMTVPGLVSQPNADETELKTKDHLLVKSFKDSKFYAVHKKDTKEFTREAALKNEDKALKVVYEKALLYFDAKELPQHWDKEDLLGAETDSDDDDDQSSDNEPSEEKDMFVAQLYKFMDDRATPINKGPLIGNRDLNLYRLFRVVHKLGGYNRVTNQMKWRLVYSKMGLPNVANASNQMKNAYKKYLHAFEDFYRKLGSSMGTITRPNRTRVSSSRNIPGFRDRGDRGESSPRSPRGGATGVSSVAKKTGKEETQPEPGDNSEKSVQESRPVKVKQEEVRSKALEEPSDSESPSKRRTRTLVEERGKPGVEKEEAKLKKRPIRKKLTKTEEAERDELRKPGKDESKDDADDEDEEEEEEPETEKTPAPEEMNNVKKYENVEYPPGSKLKIKYGKGKNVKAYEAKVLDCKMDTGSMHYLVHYNGWNMRYDEWVKKDRILECLHKADGKRPLNTAKPPVLGTAKAFKKKILTPKPGMPNLKEEKEKLSKSTSPKMSKLSKAPRPTRSTSVENQLAHGLSPRKRPRKLSGYTEASDDKSQMSGESSSSDEDDEDLAGEDEGIPDLELMAGRGEETSEDPRESAFDIMKELQADIDFDKASQDSLERDLNIKVPDKGKLEKSDSEGDMDINTILSCLKRDEYKFPSSESESVKSEGPEKRVVRGKTKTKGELKAKPDLSKLQQKPEALKTRGDTNKAKLDTPKSKSESGKVSSPEQSKSKADSPKTKLDMTRARVDLSRAKIDPELTKTRADTAVTRKEVSKTKTELTAAAKTKQEVSKSKDTAINSVEKGSISVKDEIPVSPVDASNGNTDTDKSAKASAEKASSSGDEQTSSDKPKGRRKKENVEEEKVDNKNESPSKTRGKGRPKRRFEKEELQDSEEEPVKKKTRQKPKRRSESESDEKSVPPRLSTVENEAVKIEEEDRKQEEDANEWLNAPELTATPKLELECMEDCEATDEPAPSLSPIHLRSSSLRSGGGSGAPRSPETQPEQATKTLADEIKKVEDQEEQQEEGKEKEDDDDDGGEKDMPVPKAFTSTVENTPPQTPEYPSNTPRHDNASEACSTRSEMEANLEVEGYLEGARPPGEESPEGEVYDPSNLSTASDESLNQTKLGEEEVTATTTTPHRVPALVKRKVEDSTATNNTPQPQKRRRGLKKSNNKIKDTIAARRNVSDYDDEDSKDAVTTSTKSSFLPSSICSSFPALSKPVEFPVGPSRYNFIEQLEEGKYLTGESQVNFLLGKISDLRSVYLQLKAEVASIDRRRKKLRKKQRIAQETAAEGLIGLEQSVS